LINNFQRINENDEDMTYLPTTPVLIPGCTGSALQLFHELQTIAKGKSFVFALSKDDSFVEHARSSISTPNEEFFITVFSMEPAAKTSFNDASRKMISILFGLLVKSLQAGHNTIDASFHSNVLKLLQSRVDLNVQIQFLVPELQQKPTAISVLVLTYSRWLMAWTRLAMVSISQKLNPSVAQINTEVSVEQEKLEVHRFFGWSIFHLRRKLDQQRRRQVENMVDCNLSDWDVTKMIDALDRMRVFHIAVIGDKNYMKRCYAETLQIENDGWLTLVSLEFFSFGKSLMVELRTHLAQSRIKNVGNVVIEESRQDIIQNPALKQLFKEAMDQLSTKADEETLLKEATMMKLYKRLVNKVFKAYAKFSVNTYREYNTSRRADKGQDEAHRPKLAALTLKKTKAKAKRLLKSDPSEEKKQKKQQT
jgi:hypothetical protein